MKIRHLLPVSVALLLSADIFAATPAYDYLMRHYLDRSAPLESTEQVTQRIKRTIQSTEEAKLPTKQLQRLLEKHAHKMYNRNNKLLSKEINQLTQYNIEDMEQSILSDTRYKNLLTDSMTSKEKISAALVFDIEQLRIQSSSQLSNIDQKEMVESLKNMEAELESRWDNDYLFAVTKGVANSETDTYLKIIAYPFSVAIDVILSPFELLAAFFAD